METLIEIILTLLFGGFMWWLIERTKPPKTNYDIAKCEPIVRDLSKHYEHLDQLYDIRAELYFNSDAQYNLNCTCVSGYELQTNITGSEYMQIVIDEEIRREESHITSLLQELEENKCK